MSLPLASNVAAVCHPVRCGHQMGVKVCSCTWSMLLVSCTFSSADSGCSMHGAVVHVSFCPMFLLAAVATNLYDNTSCHVMPIAPHAYPLQPLALFLASFGFSCCRLLCIPSALGLPGDQLDGLSHQRSMISTPDQPGKVSLYSRSWCLEPLLLRVRIIQPLATFPGCTAGVLAFGSMLQLLLHCNHNVVQCVHKIVVKSACSTIWLEAGNGFCADTWATSTLV